MDRPKVGVGVIVVKEGKVLLQRRRGAHGEGTWGFPGGHLEFKESWEECAKREAFEEFGIYIKNVRFVGVTNDVMENDDKHYITIFMLGDYESGEVKVKEPDRTEIWQWVDWNNMPEPLFQAIVNLKQQGFDFSSHLHDASVRFTPKP